MKRYISIFLILCTAGLKAQSSMYVSGLAEGGVFKTNYTAKEDLPKKLIDSESGNYIFKVGASFTMEWERFSAEAGISQSFRFWTLKGSSSSYDLKVKHKQSFPSVFAGAYYRIPLLSSNVNLNLYFGSSFGVDFVNYNALNKENGSITDYVISTTEESSKVMPNIIPELGIKGYFRNGNTWQAGVRYNIPVGDKLINGKVEHYIKGVAQAEETINYWADGSHISLVFRYSIKLQR